MTHVTDIIFSPEMVRALLDGRKTMTRRLAWRAGYWADEPPWVASKWQKVKPGHLLWVREVHYVWKAGYKDGSGRHISYRATEPDTPTTWTPSIHCPRWASRLTLEVTAARMERLQDISREDAIAEGVDLGSLATQRSVQSFFVLYGTVCTALLLGLPIQKSWCWRLRSTRSTSIG